jgi:hypothetical protein
LVPVVRITVDQEIEEWCQELPGTTIFIPNRSPRCDRLHPDEPKRWTHSQTASVNPPVICERAAPAGAQARTGGKSRDVAIRINRASGVAPRLFPDQKSSIRTLEVLPVSRLLSRLTLRHFRSKVPISRPRARTLPSISFSRVFRSKAISVLSVRSSAKIWNT